MFIKKIGNKVLTLFYPHRCAGCDTVVSEEGTLCSSCMKKIKTLREPTCLKCGKKVKSDEEVFCYDCARKHHEFERGFCVFEYKTVKESLYRFKYAGRAEYAEFYAKEAVKQYGDVIAQIGADALIPVPLHKKRYRMRGYNQAEEFAKAIARRIKIPVYGSYIRRVKNTVPLKKLSGIQRQNNLKRAFLIRQNDVKLKTIIVVDDIYTTGATIDAVAKECKRAGVKRVFFITVAAGEGL